MPPASSSQTSSLERRRGRNSSTRVLHALAELVVGQLAAGRADDGEVLGQQAAHGRRVQRRHQLALGQVAGRAEDDEDARLGAAPELQALCERVLLVRRRHQARRSWLAAFAFLTACTAWPPNWLRSAALTLAANDSSCREREAREERGGDHRHRHVLGRSPRRPSSGPRRSPRRSRGSPPARRRPSSNALCSSSSSHERTTEP